jgi:hypothetical protein
VTVFNRTSTALLAAAILSVGAAAQSAPRVPTAASPVVRPEKRGDLYYPEPARKHGFWGFALVGAGVVAAGAGTYFGTKNLSATSEWRAATAPAAITDARNRANSAATSATIAWVAAGVLASVGLGLVLFTQF